MIPNKMITNIEKGGVMIKTFISLLLILFFSNIAEGQWIKNGLVVFDTITNKTYSLPQIAGDASGTGAYICWADIRNFPYENIYAQRIDSSGKIYWQRNGVLLCHASGGRDWPQIISDGDGGFIAAWEDYRNPNSTDIYSQKVDINGKLLWGDSAVGLSNKYPGLFVKIASDGDGGAFYTWIYYGAHDYMVLAQKVNKLGKREWGDAGIIVAGPSERVIYNHDAVISVDGNGGAVITWAESGDIYSQRFDKKGKRLWGEKGVLISTNNDKSQIFVYTIFDGINNTYVTWVNYDGILHLQKITNEGLLLWKSDKIDSMPYTGGGGARRLISDKEGGIFLGVGRSIQHIDSSGKKLWGDHGAYYIDSTAEVTNSQMVNDGDGGVINVSQATIGYPQVVAQKIDKYGKASWGKKGKPLTDNPEMHNFPQIVSDGNGGGIVTWGSKNIGFAVLALRITNDGILTRVSEPNSNREGDLQLKNYPNPFNPETTILYTIPKKGLVEIKIYDLQGKEVICLEKTIQEGGEHKTRWDGRTNAGAKASSGMYFYQIVFDNKVLTKKMILIH